MDKKEMFSICIKQNQKQEKQQPDWPKSTTKNRSYYYERCFLNI